MVGVALMKLVSGLIQIALRYYNVNNHAVLSIVPISPIVITHFTVIIFLFFIKLPEMRMEKVCFSELITFLVENEFAVTVLIVVLGIKKTTVRHSMQWLAEQNQSYKNFTPLSSIAVLIAIFWISNGFWSPIFDEKWIYIPTYFYVLMNVLPFKPLSVYIDSLGKTILSKTVELFVVIYMVLFNAVLSTMLVNYFFLILMYRKCKNSHGDVVTMAPYILITAMAFEFLIGVEMM